MRPALASILCAIALAALLPQVAEACSRPPGYTQADDETEYLRTADTVVQGEVIAVTGGGLDNGGSVWVRRTGFLYGSKAPAIVELGHGYGAQCPRDYFMLDNEVHVGDHLLIIGNSVTTSAIPLADVFFIDAASPHASRLLAQWRQLHPDAQPARR